MLYPFEINCASPRVGEAFNRSDKIFRPIFQEQGIERRLGFFQHSATYRNFLTIELKFKLITLMGYLIAESTLFDVPSQSDDALIVLDLVHLKAKDYIRIEKPPKLVF